MTLARGAALGAVAIAIVLVAVLLLTGGSSHTYKVRFLNAGQLVKGDDVQVGGRRIGSIDSINLTNNNQAEIDVSIDSDFAPLHQGTVATIRATSLSGIANRYISLRPGANNAAKLPDGATLQTDQTHSIVDLDQLFNTLNPRTRLGLQRVVQGSATQYQGKGLAANRAAYYFNPALSTSDRLVSELTRDSTAFTNFIVNSSRVVSALAARRDDLTNLVSNTAQTTGAIAAQDASLDQALRVLPQTLRQGNTTFVNLRATLDDLDPLVSASLPATKRLAPFLRALRPLVTSARPTIKDLRTLIYRKGPNNDLIDVLHKTPQLAAAARPAFANSITALRKSQPVLEFIRPYTPELIGWIRDFGQGASNYDANGHFARISPIANAFSFVENPAGGLLSPIPPSLRYQGLSVGNIKRCPGTASQAPADGSAPFTDGGALDCNPSLIPPGP